MPRRRQHRSRRGRQPRHATAVREAAARSARRPALECVGQLPRREIEEGRDGRQARRDRQPATGGVVDGARRATVDSARQAAPSDAPRSRNGSMVSARRAEQPDRRQQSPTDHLEVRVPRRRVVLIAGQQEGERLAGQRVGVERRPAARRGMPPSEARASAPGAPGRPARPGCPVAEAVLPSCGRAITSPGAAPASGRAAPRAGAGRRRRAPRPRSGATSCSARHDDRGR